ncbi:MAG TPA: hypothetical protein VJ962_11715 [Clostridia bacterium]|nr:hypothetical protein [Clostridia bacterium]
MEKELCDERRETIMDCIKENKKIIAANSIRIGEVELEQSRTQVEIRNLIDQVKSLVTIIKWLIAAILTGFGGFFINYIQGI